MAEFSMSDRLIKAALAPVWLGGWCYFVPDYSTLGSTPLGQLTISEIIECVLWLALGVFCVRAAVSLLYEAYTGRDSVWLWHPNKS
jgi:hypothetical protein